MKSELFTIPVLFVTFNRPDLTVISLSRILEANPPKIYFFNDGPRIGNSNDGVSCQAIRILIDSMDYQGEFIPRFEEINLGCKNGVSTAITWFFENEEMGIIIEDDILPTIDFFYYCQEMLHLFRHDDRIFSISGCNLLNIFKEQENDYFFTNYPNIWGWASWRRVWLLYDVAMSDWNNPETRELVLQYLPTKEFRELKIAEFDSLVSGQNNTWDYQFYFSHLIHHALGICPSKNLIENIGIDHKEAVHMIGDSPFSDLRHQGSITLPMKHNPIMVPDNEYAEKSIRKGYPYFYEIPVYPEPPKPNTSQKISIAVGKMIGQKGLLRYCINFVLGRK